MKIILLFFLLAFVGLTVIFGAIRRFLRMFVDIPEQQARQKQQPKREKGGLNTSTAKARKKVISHDEGEYIDFEEVK